MKVERVRTSHLSASYEMQLETQTVVVTKATREGAPFPIECILTLFYRGVYGLGEKFDALNQKGRTVRNQVIEKFCNQGAQTYCSIPFFLTDSGLGVFADTKRETLFSFEEEAIHLFLPSKTDLYLYAGTPSEILKAYLEQLEKTYGALQMPPRFAFGPWISANHWDSEEKTRRALQELHHYRFPATVLVLEAWSDEATFYIFNGATYAPKEDGAAFSYEEFFFSPDGPWKDPKGLIEDLNKEGIHTVLWQIPAYKPLEEGEWNPQNRLDEEDALYRGLCVMRGDGTPYRIPQGNWFEGSLLPDFTNPETVKTWFAKRQYLLDIGVAGFKTDGGEFIYEEDLHFENGDSGREGKNAFCQTYISHYHQFIGRERVLFSRAGFTGAQTTPILWAGDHQSTFLELKGAFVAALSAAASGILYWGFDIGGFAGPLPDPELYLRSTQFACFCPVMQWHSEPDGGQFKELMPGSEGNNERSPWNIAAHAADPGYLEELRYWHNLRMLLLPYLTSEAEKSALDKVPMMRPLFWEDRSEEALQHEEEYFFGDSLLVAPILEAGVTERLVYFPKGANWIGLYSGKRYEGGDEAMSEERYPVYVREGAALPLVQSLRVLTDPDFVAENRTEQFHDLLLLTAGKTGSYRFFDEAGEHLLTWEAEDPTPPLLQERNLRIS